MVRLALATVVGFVVRVIETLVLALGQGHRVRPVEPAVGALVGIGIRVGIRVGRRLIGHGGLRRIGLPVWISFGISDP